MAKSRVCLNCGKDITHKRTDAKSCGDPACTKALQRGRKRRGSASREALAGIEAETTEARRTTIVKREVEREVRAIIKPVVREALTEDVMVALEDLIKLTPEAVATLSAHMDDSDPESYDAVLAQKAATTVLRYTVGHQALVTPQEATAPQLVVNFGLPRPGAEQPYDATTKPIEVEEEFECDVCHEVLLTTERVAGADRCSECHETRKRAVLEQYGLLS